MYEMISVVTIEYRYYMVFIPLKRNRIVDNNYILNYYGTYMSYNNMHTIC